MAAPENSSCFFKERAAASEKIFKNVRLPLKDIRKNVQLHLRITST